VRIHAQNTRKTRFFIFIHPVTAPRFTPRPGTRKKVLMRCSRMPPGVTDVLKPNETDAGLLSFIIEIAFKMKSKMWGLFGRLRVVFLHQRLHDNRRELGETAEIARVERDNHMDARGKVRSREHRVWQAIPPEPVRAYEVEKALSGGFA